MALVVYWYDFICFAIVGASIIAALWVIWQKDCAGKCRTGTKYESLLPTRSEDGQPPGSAHPSHVGTDMLWMSCWGCVHPGVLLVTRLVSGLVMAGFLAWDIKVWTADVYIYYTELVQLCLLMVASYTQNGKGYIMGSKQLLFKIHEKVGPQSRLLETKQMEIPSDCKVIMNRSSLNKELAFGDMPCRLLTRLAKKKMSPLFLILLLVIFRCKLTYTCAGAVMLTDIVFWCLIVPFLSTQRFSLNLLMGCMHVLNAVFLLLDTSLNSLPFPWFRMSYFVLWSCTYVIFQWVLHACGYSEWPYTFLELSTPWAPLWYFALALVHLPCYGLYSLIVKAKNVVFSRLFPHAYVRSC